jgi:hypothetical protein
MSDPVPESPSPVPQSLTAKILTENPDAEVTTYDTDATGAPGAGQAVVDQSMISGEGATGTPAADPSATIDTEPPTKTTSK